MSGPLPTDKDILAARGSWRKGKRRPDLPQPKSDREIPPTPSLEVIEGYARGNLLGGYDQWRDSQGYTFDLKHARGEIEWCYAHLTHVRGEFGGKAFVFQPWQISLWANLFSWFEADGEPIPCGICGGSHGPRRYRNCSLYIAEGNGKTPIAAAMALRVAEDEEPGFEIYGVAYNKEQARLVWDWARGMVLNDEWLSERWSLYQHSMIRVSDPLSYYKPIAAVEEGVHGANPHCGIVDEEHTFPVGKEKVIETLESKSGKRRQSLLVKLSTAGYEPESICARDWEYSRRVRDGQDGFRDARHLPVIFEAGKDDDWTLEETWKKANPNWGVAVDPQAVRDAFQKALHSPSRENTFRRLKMNQWTQQDEIWIQNATWRSCGSKFEIGDLADRECYGGLDLSHKHDLSSFSLCFPPVGTERRYRLLVWHWLPGAEIADKEQKDRAPYRQWEKEGWVSITPTPVVDYPTIRAEILELAEKVKIVEIAYDPWNASHLVSLLEQQDGFTMVEMRQGFYTMSPLTKEFERLLLDGRLEHNNNPVMLWQVGQASTKRDKAGNIMPDKTNPRARIDGVVSGIMSVGRAIVNVESSISVYAEREPLVLNW